MKTRLPFATAVILATLMLLLAAVGGIAVWRARDDQQRNEALARRSSAVAALEDARAQLFLGATWVASSAIGEDAGLFYELNQEAEETLREGLARARAELSALGKTEEVATVDRSVGASGSVVWASGNAPGSIVRKRSMYAR